MTVTWEHGAPRSARRAGEPAPVAPSGRRAWGWRKALRGPHGWDVSRRTVRLRLTALYGALFLVAGAGLLAITYLLVEGAPFAGPRNYRPPMVSGNVAIAVGAERSIVLHALLLRSGIALGIMALVSVWLGWVVAGRVLAPLRLIASRTLQISQENLHERLALSGPHDEIKDLSDTIDDLLARLERAFNDQRRFVANVSHELRTPLAMMRTSLDVAAAKPWPMSKDASALSGKVREGLDQADRLVESFLVLARAEAPGMSDAENVSLPSLVRRALDNRTEAIDKLGLTVREHLGQAPVTGSDTLLSRLVANLLDNAVGHNEPGGMIDIKTETHGPTARLIVQSGGRRIDPDEAAQLTQPFQRLQTDRTGSENGVGLGLAIVAAITSAHHGVLNLQARPEGGLTAIVDLPRTRIPASSGAVV